MSLTRRARELYPASRRLAAKYVLAARSLRRNGKWVHDGAEATWAATPDRRQKERPAGYPIWPRTAREWIEPQAINMRHEAGYA